MTRAFAIIPAAGRSRRMGQAKLLMPWPDEDGRQSTVIAEVIRQWSRSRVSRIVMVVHPQDETLARVGQECGAEVVAPDSAPPQMKDSILLALDWLRANDSPSATDLWMLAPADMPWLDAGVIDSLIQSHNQETPQILVASYRQRRGHPVAFPWTLVQEVCLLGADEGVRVLFDRFPLRMIECDQPLILQDMDTPEQYQKMLKQCGGL